MRPGWRALGRLADVPEGQTRGYPGLPGQMGLFAVHRGGRLLVYVNACPHIGVPLDIMPDRFLDGPGRAIVCAVHGARFRIEDGFCLAGPCAGDSLEAVEVVLDAEGTIWVPQEAGA
jgi:nitrite reductase/ring-hydroxylating ferredoxin subunit